MPSEQLVLGASTATPPLQLSVPATRVVITMEANAAETYVTCDGTLPVVPSAGVEVTGSQRCLAGVVGVQLVLQPPFVAPPGAAGPPGMVPAIIQAISGGTPTILVEW
jgi:hypothetical protein